jgi:hypothetical protein
MAAAAAAMHREAAERRYRSESSYYYPTSASADREVSWPPTPGRPGARAGPPHHHDSDGHYYDDHAGAAARGGRLGHPLATPSQLDYYSYWPEAASLSAWAVDSGYYYGRDYGPGHRDGAAHTGRHNDNYCSLDRDRDHPAASGSGNTGRLGLGLGGHGAQGATHAASGSCRSNVSSDRLSSCHGSRQPRDSDSPSSTRSHRGHHPSHDRDSDDRCFEPASESDSGSDSDDSGCSTAAQHHSGRPTRSRYYYYESPTQARHHDLQTGGRTGSGTAGPLMLPVPVGSTSSRSVPISSRDDPRHKSRLGPYW